MTRFSAEHEILEVKVEFIRPGALSGQLLSPMTPYVTVCNDEHVETTHLPLDHFGLLRLLQSLDYGQKLDRRHGGQIALGQEMARVLGMIRTLPGVLSRHSARLTHLRLMLGGSELAALPLEAADSLASATGTYRPLLLEPGQPLIITRETRRSAGYPVDFTRPPRVLVIAASPTFEHQVPLREHVLALYKALEPFEYRSSRFDQAGRSMNEMLTILPHATRTEIMQACSTADPPYTHVHVLVHGAQYEVSGQKQIGITVHSESAAGGCEVLSGRDLAQLLRSPRASGDHLAGPLWVTLLSCDGAARGSEILPLGSVAEELHHGGVPWVLASHLPLSIQGSTRIAVGLYRELFMGHDPRWVLYRLRQNLSTLLPERHDWLSLVVFASIPPHLNQHVNRAKHLRHHEALSALLNRIDRDGGDTGRARGVSQAARQACESLHQQLSQTNAGNTSPGDEHDDELLDHIANHERNIAYLIDGIDTNEGRLRLARARSMYKDLANRSPEKSWYRVHAISLGLVLGEQVSAADWCIAHHAAAQYADGHDPAMKCWGLANLIELHFLATCDDARRLQRILDAEEPMQGSERGQMDVDFHVGKAKKYALKLRQAYDRKNPAFRKICRLLSRYRQAFPQQDNTLRSLLSTLGMPDLPQQQ